MSVPRRAALTVGWLMAADKLDCRRIARLVAGLLPVVRALAAAGS